MTVLAAAQFDPHLGDIAYNLDRIITMLHIATTRGAQLISRARYASKPLEGKAE